jgi:TctA family transporter
MLEEYLKRALKLARGDWSVFITRPLSAALLALGVILLLVVLMIIWGLTRLVDIRKEL